MTSKYINIVQNIRASNMRFVSTFKHSDDEESGIKPYTIRKKKSLRSHHRTKILRFQKGIGKLTVTIQRGYTNRCHTHTVTHILEWDDNVIFAWNPNEVRFFK